MCRVDNKNKVTDFWNWRSPDLWHFHRTVVMEERVKVLWRKHGVDSFFRLRKCKLFYVAPLELHGHAIIVSCHNLKLGCHIHWWHSELNSLILDGVTYFSQNRCCVYLLCIIKHKKVKSCNKNCWIYIVDFTTRSRYSVT